ncbi:MAG: DNRLRE domain-containing protein [SAR202 cluster bacterium]|nr:DNRLRE domain-containing protein [SAR202 cluster bacterium]
MKDLGLITRLISPLLILAILFAGLPMGTAQAQTSSPVDAFTADPILPELADDEERSFPPSPDNAPITTAGDQLKSPQASREILQKRTSKSKTVLNVDGTYTDTVYSSPVHYEESPGVWRDIDNTLRPSLAEGYAFEKTANSFTAMFGDVSSADGVKVALGDQAISFGLEGAAEVEPVVEGNKITYPEVYPGVDLVLTVNSDGVKEEIVLKQPVKDASFTFTVGTAGLDVRENEDGTIGLYSGDKQVMYMPKAFMYDSGNNDVGHPNRSSDVSMEIKDGYLIITPNAEWLADSSRVYPLVIDPTITMQPDATSAKDTSFESDTPTVNYHGDYLTVFSYAGYYSRALVQFDLSHIPASATIDSADLSLYAFDWFVNDDVTLNVHAVTNPWTEAGATWQTRDGSTNWTSTGGDFYATSSASFFSDYPSWQGWYDFDITGLAADWVSGVRPNYGAMIKVSNESPSTNLGRMFQSSDTTSDYQPKLEITYSVDSDNNTSNGLGLESYYASQSWSLGAKTTLYTTLTSKHNVVAQKNLISIPGRGIGFDVALFYNSKANQSCDSASMGSNWQISPPRLSVTPTSATINGPDGAIHLFENRTAQGDGTYKYQSASGLRWTLVENTNTGKWLLTSDIGLVHEFSGSSTFGDGSPAFQRLLSTYDGFHTANKLTYNYDGGGYVSSISDSSTTARSVNFTWTSGHCSGSKVLTAIEDPDGIDTILNYATSTGYAFLSSVEEAAGTGDARTTYFGYQAYSAGSPYAVLTTVTDPKNATTTIAYHTGFSDKRVKTVTDTRGNVTRFDYHDNYATSTDRVYIENAEYGMVVWDLVGPNQDNPGVLRYGNAYNGSFEKTSVATIIQAWSGNSPGGSHTRDTSVKYAGDASAKLNTNATSTDLRWSLELYEGDNTSERFRAVTGEVYTGKVWLKTSSVSGAVGAFMRMEYYDNNLASWQQFDSPAYTGTNDWFEVSTPSVKMPSSADKLSLTIKLNLYNATGSVWFDVARVEAVGMSATWDANLIVQQVDASNATTTFSYGGDEDSNPSGNPNNLVAVTDRLGNVTEYRYNHQNRVVEQWSPKFEGSSTSTESTYNSKQELTQKVDELGGTWNYTYDFWGQQLTVKDPNAIALASSNPTGMTYEYAYNGYGLLTDIYTPINASSTKARVQMAYDNERSLMTSRTDAKGQQTCFEYDYLSRLATTTYMCATGSAFAVTYKYDKNDNRTQMVDIRNGAFATTTYEYFATNIIKKITEPDGLYTQYTYDSIGNMLTLRNADGETVTYQYDVNGRVNDIDNTYDGGNTRPVYDLSGRLRSIGYPSGNAISFSYTSGGVDQGGRLTQVNNSRNGVSLKKFNYQYDDNGNMTRLVEDINVVTTTYAYTDLNQISSSSRVGANSYTQTFTYDGNGNRTQMSVGGATYSYTFNAANWMLSETVGTTTKSFTYENNGNLKSEGSGIYYGYDGADRMVTSSIDGTSHTYVYVWRWLARERGELDDDPAVLFRSRHDA